MIDLSKIRSLKTLEEMKQDLNEFLVNPDVRTIYLEDYGWGEEDYESDRDEVTELLEKVERRIKSLDKYIKGQATTQDSQPLPKSETEETPSEQ